MAEHNLLGIKGEEQAVKFLENKGFKILETNWRCEKAEVDIIALDKDILVFAEVKTRTNAYFGQPEEFVSSTKEKLMAQAANQYIEENNISSEVRFDIIAIIFSKNKFKIKHIPEAFYPFE